MKKETQPITVRVDKQLVEQIDTIARAERRSRADVIRLTLEKYVPKLAEKSDRRPSLFGL